MSEHLISEPIKPLTETADTSRMALGEPGLHREFVLWGRTVTVLWAITILAANREV